jgi:methyl-coenzyme M reductase subunit D
MLSAEKTAKFLDGLVTIPGIRRMLIHGPGYSTDLPGGSEYSCKIQPPDFFPVHISDQQICIHVLMGDLVIETFDEEVIEDIAEYCVEFFYGMTFQIMIGQFIKPALSLADYMRNFQEPDEDLVGLSDCQERIEPAIIPYRYHMD